MLQLKYQLCQVVIATLNWETLSHPSQPPAKACIGSRMSLEQSNMIDRILGMIAHFTAFSSFVPSELGRASEQFDAFLQDLQGLDLLTKELPNYHEIL